MGSDLGLPVVESYDELIASLKEHRIGAEQNPLAELQQSGETFLKLYDRCIRGSKMFPDDFKELFDHLDACFKVFTEFCRYHLSDDQREAFLRDLREMSSVLSAVLTVMSGILQKFLLKTTPILSEEFVIASKCCSGALQVKELHDDPFYELKIIPVLTLIPALLSTQTSNISIVSPHNTGKTHTIPLILAMKMCSELLKRPFLIICESSAVMLKSLVEFVEDIEDEDGIRLVQTMDSVLEELDKEQQQPIVAVLSQMDALSLFSKCKDLTQLLSKALFVIDDMHVRSVETDLLLRLIAQAGVSARLQASTNMGAQITLMSATPDPNFVRYLRNVQELTVDPMRPFPVEVRRISGTQDAITRELVLVEAKKQVLAWGAASPNVPVGSMLVYMPGEKISYRFVTQIRRSLERNRTVTQRPVVPLYTDVVPNDTCRSFYARVRREIEIKTAEKGDAFARQKPLFIVTIVLHKYFTPEMCEIVTTHLQPNLKEKVARVVVMTESNVSLHIPDVTVVVDTGIHEVEFFDENTGLPYIQEDPVPEPYRKAREGLLGQTNAGIAIMFDAEGVERPDSEIPAVRRIDLSKHCLMLRRCGIELEKIKNLPTEPKYALLEASTRTLRNIGILTDMNETTELGRQAVKFSFLHPIFAGTVAKLAELEDGTNRTLFACTVCYIIEHGMEMIVDPKNQSFRTVFEPRSDLVTVLMVVIGLLSEERETTELLCKAITEAGIRPVYIFELSKILRDISDKELPEIVTILRDWIAQKGDAFTAVDEVISCANELNTEWFERRKARFVQIMNAGSQPFIVFRCGQELIGTNEQVLRISDRPGWKGLVTPGSCYILSILCNKTRGIAYGGLIHECTSSKEYGVVSKQVDPCLNSPFFVSLFDTYMGNENHDSLFVGIQMTERNDPKTAFVIHLSKVGDETFMNYCPRNDAVHQLTLDAIATLRPLLPYVPRSILVKNPNPLCAIEIAYHSTSSYDTHLHFFTDESEEVPRAYCLNADILKLLAGDTRKLSAQMPRYRFALTGECFLYHMVDGRQVEIDLEYPDARPVLDTVFGEWASHLVLLVDKREEPLAGQELRWTGAERKRNTEKVDPREMIAVASQVMEAHGRVALTSDLFVVALNNCKLHVKRGELPKEFWVECNSTDGNDMQCTTFELMRALGRDAMKHHGNIPAIPIQELDSKAQGGGQEVGDPGTVSRELGNKISTAFHIPIDNVMVNDVSKELYYCRVEGLPIEQTLHNKPSTLLDQTYQPCPADAVVLEQVDSKYNPCVRHATCVGFTINHMVTQRLTEETFTSTVKALRDKYGFFVTCFDDYQRDPDPEGDRIGSIFIEVCDTSIAVALAQDIQASIDANAGFDGDAQMMSTRTMLQSSVACRRGAVAKGRARFGDVGIEQLKEMIAMRALGHADASRWKDGEIRIIPGAGDVETREQLMLRLMRETDKVVCFYISDRCTDEDRIPVPAPLFSFNQDSTVDEYVVCRDCMLLTLQDAMNMFFNQDTHMLNIEAVMNRPDALPAIPSVDSQLIDDEYWPTVPIGTLLYNLMSDRMVAPYVKAWVTACARLAIRSAAHQVTFCPNHPMFPMRLPKNDDQTIKCPHCNNMLCSICKTWHTMDEACQEDIPGAKRCPRCNLPTFKYTGCNRITCPCGCHWCYVCREGFDNPGACYSHMRATHGGYFTDPWAEVEQKRQEEIQGAKRCPRCSVPILKTQGCNHITCRCGCHWCYVCRQGFDKSGDCYSHMNSAHGGYFTDPWA